MRPKPHHSSWLRRMGMLKTFLEKSLSVLRLGLDWTNKLLGSLADAARSISYVETVNPSQTDTLHREIKRSEERWFKQGFELCVRDAIPKLGLRHVKVAIDVTEDQYWGDASLHTRASAHEKHIESWQYVNLAIVDPYFVPLMSLPYWQTDSLDEIVIDLLEYLQTLPFNVDLILFDRGFYHWHLIDYLNSKKLPYILFVPKNKAMKKFIAQTKGPFCVFKHLGKYLMEKSTWIPQTKIVILKGATKNKKGEPIDWCFATNQPAELQLVSTYRKRWNIETGFRIHDEAKIKSKSAHPLIRFFYHLIGMLFILLWRIQRKIFPTFVFKRFLKHCERTYLSVQLGTPPR